MSQTEIVYARLELSWFRDTFTLEERKDEINARLYEVLHDDYYLKSLTEQLGRVEPKMKSWLDYKENPLSGLEKPDLKAIGKFAVTDQKVDLVDIRFY